MMQLNSLFFRAYFSIVIVMLFASCKQHTVAPQNLVGIWKNTSSQYLDRYMEFYDRLLIFGTGSCAEDINYIREIGSVKLQKNNMLYIIHYKDKQYDNWILKLQYDPESGGTIHIANRPEVWKRSNDERIVNDLLDQLCL